MVYLIRTAGPEDVDAIGAMEEACFSDPWSRAMIADELQKENVFFLVADDGGAVCGYAEGEDICGDFYINNIAVAEPCRKKHIAETLLRRLIQTARERNCFCVTLEVRESNLPAQRLYEKCGLSRVGIRTNYYRFPTENALIYTLFLQEDEP